MSQPQTWPVALKVMRKSNSDGAMASDKDREIWEPNAADFEEVYALAELEEELGSRCRFRALFLIVPISHTFSCTFFLLLLI